METQKPQMVIFSTAYFPLVGGAEVAMKETTDRLPEFEFHLICAKIKPGLADIERIGNIQVHRVGFGHKVDKYLLPFWGALLAVTRLKPVAIWSLMASYGGFASRMYLFLKPKTPFLLTLQEGDPLEHYKARVGVLQGLHQSIFKKATAVHAISKFLGAWATKMGFTGTPSIIPNGVDVARFTQLISLEDREAMRASWGVTSDRTVIVTASRLTLKNATDDLILSLKYLPESCVLVVAGEGEDRGKCETIARSNGVDARVKFLGTQGHDVLPKILQSSDIFCRPSLSEGLGISFLEAMASGIPIIGTLIGGIPDFLEDGVTGLSCEPRNPESIAKAVSRYVNEPELRARIVHDGKDLVCRNYAWNDLAKRVGNVIRSLIQ